MYFSSASGAPPSSPRWYRNRALRKSFDESEQLTSKFTSGCSVRHIFRHLEW